MRWCTPQGARPQLEDRCVCRSPFARYLHAILSRLDGDSLIAALWRQQELVESIPRKIRMLMDAPVLGELHEGMQQGLYFTFPPPSEARLQTARDSHVQMRHRVSAAKVQTAAQGSSHHAPVGAVLHASSQSTLLPAVNTRGREAMESELGQLRRELAFGHA